MELKCAIDQGAWIICIFIGNTILPEKFKFYLMKYQYFKVSENTSKDEFEKVVEKVDSVILKKVKAIVQK